MKRYIRTDTHSEIQLPLDGRYTTKRGYVYNYRIDIHGTVTVWEYYYTTGNGKVKKHPLHSIPKEMREYLNTEYGSRLFDLGITLKLV